MLERRDLLKGGAAAVAAAPISLAAPIGACPARYVGVPPAVVCMGDQWVSRWLLGDAGGKEFMEIVCEGLAFLPSKDRDDLLSELVERSRRILDARIDASMRSDRSTDLLSEADAMRMAGDTVEEGGMAALNLAIRSLRLVCGRFGDEGFAVGNLNALMLTMCIAGTMLTALGHPDFATTDEAVEGEGA